MIDTAEGGLEGGSSQHICTSIPANVLDGVEFVGNAWNGGSNDHAIQSDKKDGKIDADDDKPELWGLGVEVFFGICIVVVFDEWSDCFANGWARSRSRHHEKGDLVMDLSGMCVGTRDCT